MDALTPEGWVSIIVGILTIATVLYRSGRLVEQFERRVDRLEDNTTRRLDNLNSWPASFSKQIHTFFGILVEMLSNRQQLTSSEVALVTKAFTDLNTPAVETLFQTERTSHNPLSPEGLALLENYYGRLRAGQLLSNEEIQDYNRLVSVLQAERPTDPGVLALLALGAFLLGLMIGRSSER